MHYLYRPYTNDFRFSSTQLAGELGLPATRHSVTRALISRCLELGAKHIGQARVNLVEGGEQMKDSVYSVGAEDWDAFLAAFRQGPLPEVPTTSRKARASEVRRARLERIEKKLDRILAILTDER